MAVLRHRSPYLADAADALDDRLRQGFVSYYLSYRALDDIEDCPALSAPRRAALLRRLAAHLIDGDIAGTRTQLREVNGLGEIAAHLPEWLEIVPAALRPRMFAEASRFADRAAFWADREWRIRTSEHLAAYVHDVGGAVGISLSALWTWHEGLTPRPDLAEAYASYMHAVDLAFDRDEDLERGVDLFPDGWTKGEMLEFAQSFHARAVAFVSEVRGTSAFELSANLLRLNEHRERWVRETLA